MLYYDLFSHFANLYDLVNKYLNKCLNSRDDNALTALGVAKIYNFYFKIDSIDDQNQEIWIQIHLEYDDKAGKYHEGGFFMSNKDLFDVLHLPVVSDDMSD
jgi:hypothetical protein